MAERADRPRDSRIAAIVAESACEALVTAAGRSVATSPPPTTLRPTMNTTGAVAPARPDRRSAPQGARTAPLRLAIIDGDSGFLHVVEKRVRARGWQQRVLPGRRADRGARRAAPRRARDRPGRARRVGLDLPRAGLHARCPALPVIVCSGPSTVAQRVQALRLGADDWLAKPCHPEELLARIEAIVRRGRVAAPPAERSALEAGEIVDPPGPVPGVRRRPQPRPHAPRVRADPPAGRATAARCWSAR